ncbi:hypothetical protein NDU88_001366 [Pleurodeles waltl]|uniref:Uncharacterized protein n=1 Tax=Pleurodeles waltl TaxID=8319 RepID=A0AAV7VZ95_PLEWA|nr:hypothetical protein NDU88_001366 [Pleurodeles waltl]
MNEDREFSKKKRSNDMASRHRRSHQSNVQVGDCALVRDRFPAISFPLLVPDDDIENDPCTPESEEASEHIGPEKPLPNNDSVGSDEATSGQNRDLFGRDVVSCPRLKGDACTNMLLRLKGCFGRNPSFLTTTVDGPWGTCNKVINGVWTTGVVGATEILGSDNHDH